MYEDSFNLTYRQSVSEMELICPLRLHLGEAPSDHINIYMLLNIL